MSIITERRHEAAEFDPMFQTLEENVRKARRAIVEGEHKVEDAIAQAALEIRRRPVKAVSIAAVAGLTLGCIGGLVLGWKTARKM